MKSKCPYDLVSRDVCKDAISNVVRKTSKTMRYQTQKTITRQYPSHHYLQVEKNFKSSKLALFSYLVSRLLASCSSSRSTFTVNANLARLRIVKGSLDLAA
jgi:hypothetical protein